MEHDDRTGIVEKYLDELLPDNQDEYSIADKQHYFNKEYDATYIPQVTFGPAIYQREEVSPMEIWVECFNKDKADFNNKESNAISMIMAQILGWEKTGKLKVISPYSKQLYFIRKKQDKEQAKQEIYNFLKSAI